jgi:hypothetical protein
LVGADKPNRTVDLRVTSALLYQLSYIGNGAGNGDRTRAISLEGYGSTIELFPQNSIRSFLSIKPSKNLFLLTHKINGTNLPKIRGDVTFIFLYTLHSDVMNLS